MGQLCKLSYLNEPDRVAVAICRAGDHVGLLYRDESNPSRVMLFHHCWNRLLRNATPSHDDQCEFWVVPTIEPEQINAIIAHTLAIWEKNQNGLLPFGFSDPRGFFDSDGNIVFGPGQVGLTCAAMVLAIFDLSGVPLVKYDTWGQRPDDVPVQRGYVMRMRETARSQRDIEDANTAETQVGNIRFRPLEVVAGALVDDGPIDFRTAIRIASEIKSQMDA